ncbi:peptidase [Companilactobacillus sp. RD055328]|uniref:zinc metallopeptidase n=1 Tax=Companilactobacillus sp. RD055328 TaxID=2916634 RepID=UPI001FC8EB4B|nr:zinc metallopeptidase [Companilactobacillus sp. RD055328]GKQ43270.1 peptidase [Companilactobacillus sp. RD055328]
MYPMMGFFDPTYILVIIGIAIAGIAQMNVTNTFSKYDKVGSKNNITAADAAEKIMTNAGINDIRVEHIAGHLTDNYNPGNKTLNLSDASFQSTSVAAIGVAAHEAGHAIQDNKGYLPMRLRSAFVPLVNFGSTASFPLILLGMFLGMNRTLIQIGVYAFALVVIFQIITLPVEFNASMRAVRILSDSGMLRQEEIPAVKKVLTAAALTYVAAVLSTALQFLRLLILFGNRRD